MAPTQTTQPPTPAIARPATSDWDVDTTHSTVGFSVKHLMVSNVRGQFKGFTAAVRLDEADPSRSSVEAEIDVATIDTGVQQRDDHLRSADFFDVANHPKLTFRSTRVERAGADRARVLGELTIRGTTRPIVLDVERTGTITDPWGKRRAGFSASASIDRKEFGLTWNQLLEAGGVMVGDKIKIELEVEAVERPKGA